MRCWTKRPEKGPAAGLVDRGAELRAWIVCFNAAALAFRRVNKFQNHRRRSSGDLRLLSGLGERFVDQTHWNSVPDSAEADWGPRGQPTMMIAVVASTSRHAMQVDCWIARQRCHDSIFI